MLKSTGCIVATCDRMSGRNLKNTVVMVRRELCKEFNRILIGNFKWKVLLLCKWNTESRQATWIWLSEFSHRRNSFIISRSTQKRRIQWVPHLHFSVLNSWRSIASFCSTFNSTSTGATTSDWQRQRDQVSERQIYGLAVNNLYVSQRVNTTGLHKPNRSQSRFHKKILKSYDRIMAGFAYSRFPIFFAPIPHLSSIFELGNTKYRMQLADNNGRLHVVKMLKIQCEALYADVPTTGGNYYHTTTDYTKHDGIPVTYKTFAMYS